MVREIDSILFRLADELGLESPPLDDEHDRWRLYEAAITAGGSLELVREALAVDRDTVLASAVVLSALERLDVVEHEAWTGLLPSKDREYAERRSREISVLRDAVAGRLGDEVGEATLEGWSDGLQVRLAKAAASERVLELLAGSGRTKRIRRAALDTSRSRNED